MSISETASHPIAGYAVTGRIRTIAPPIANLCYYHRVEWWEHLASFPSPKVIVLHDVDHSPGTGAFFGEIHAQISKVLGCVSYVTNGTIRDVPVVAAAQFQCFASGTSVSHARMRTLSILANPWSSTGSKSLREIWYTATVTVFTRFRCRSRKSYRTQ